MTDKTDPKNLEYAEKIVGQYEGTHIRPLIFSNFEYADYYYKQKTVEALCEVIATAHDNSDEILEIDTTTRLYNLISSGLSAEEQRDCFKRCMKPLVDFLHDDDAKGHLYYILGNCVSDLGSSEEDKNEAEQYYKDAVKMRNEEILSDEKVFRQNPDLVFHWLYLNIDSQSKRFSEFERLFNKLVEANSAKAKYYYDMAELYDSRENKESDRYYRLCIHLGYDKVVNDARFLEKDYENDYWSWFKTESKNNNDPVASKILCLEKLWGSKEYDVFVDSKKKYAEVLRNTGNNCEFYKECNNFALEGFDWAETWLLEDIAESAAQEAVTDDMIQKWFDSDTDLTRDIALGRLFFSGRRKDLESTSKFNICMAKYKLDEKELSDAVKYYLKAKEKLDKNSKFNDFENSLKDIVKKSPMKFIHAELKKNNLMNNSKKIAFNCSCLSIIDKSNLKIYFETDIMPEIAFLREESDQPMCSRALLLYDMAEMAENSDKYTMPRCYQKTFENQKRVLKEQADRELNEAVKDGNLMALFVLLVQQLFSSEYANLRDGFAHLCLLAQNTDVKIKNTALLLFANCWEQKQLADKNEMFVILEWLIDDPERWIEISDQKQLLKNIFKECIVPLDDTNSGVF